MYGCSSGGGTPGGASRSRAGDKGAMEKEEKTKTHRTSRHRRVQKTSQETGVNFAGLRGILGIRWEKEREDRQGHKPRTQPKGKEYAGKGTGWEAEQR